jgi:hypothetical protein
MKKLAVFSRSGILLGHRRARFMDKYYVYGVNGALILFIIAVAAFSAYYTGTGKIPFIQPFGEFP